MRQHLRLFKKPSKMNLFSRVKIRAVGTRGTENNLSFLNHFMGTYDMFLTDLGLSTDYKSVALPIEL